MNLILNWDESLNNRIKNSEWWTGNMKTDYIAQKLWKLKKGIIRGAG